MSDDEYVDAGHPHPKQADEGEEEGEAPQEHVDVRRSSRLAHVSEAAAAAAAAAAAEGGDEDDDFEYSEGTLC